jgi:hypothetical protein
MAVPDSYRQFKTVRGRRNYECESRIEKQTDKEL